MLEGWLDFEKPIAEIEAKIKELSEQAGFRDEINRLNAQVDKLKKKIYSNLTAWQKVQLARHPRRPYTLDYIDLIAEEFIELRLNQYNQGYRVVADAGLIGLFARR